MSKYRKMIIYTTITKLQLKYGLKRAYIKRLTEKGIIQEVKTQKGKKVGYFIYSNIPNDKTKD